jgi:hypothetical protein
VDPGGRFFFLRGGYKGCFPGRVRGEGLINRQLGPLKRGITAFVLPLPGEGYKKRQSFRQEAAGIMPVMGVFLPGVSQESHKFYHRTLLISTANSKL